MPQHFATNFSNGWFPIYDGNKSGCWTVNWPVGILMKIINFFNYGKMIKNATTWKE